jgi:hypothetical protein
MKTPKRAHLAIDKKNNCGNAKRHCIETRSWDEPEAIDHHIRQPIAHSRDSSQPKTSYN